METKEPTQDEETQDPTSGEATSEGINSSNRRYWKAAILLVLFFAAISVFFWGPQLGGEPEPELQVNTPSMKNVPPTSTKQMSLEVKTDEAEQDEAEQDEAPSE